MAKVRDLTDALQAASGNGNGNGEDRRPASFIEKIVQERNEAATDPATGIPGSAPNFGKFPIPHVLSFAGISGSFSKVYQANDEALRDSRENARFMRNDCGIMECVEARQRCTAMLGWHLEPEDENSTEQVALVEELTKILNRIHRFTEYRFNLLHAVWYGRYAVQHRYRWSDVNGRMRVMPAAYRDNPGWIPVNGDKLVFRYDDGSADNKPDQVGIKIGSRFMSDDKISGRWDVEPTESGLAYFLKDWERPLLAIHKHTIEDGDWHNFIDAGMVHGVGLRSRIYWDWFQKQECLAFLMEYLERSAGGIEIWYYPQGNEEAEKKARIAAEERVANQRNIVLVPKPMGDDAHAFGVEIIEPGMGGIDALQNILNDYYGHRIKRYILGQTLSSEAQATGLGSGLAELHLDTFLQIIKYDATNLEETITHQLVKYIKDWNFPSAKGIHISFKIDVEEQDPSEKLSAWQMAFQMGAKLKESDVMELIGAAVPTEEDRVLEMPEDQMGGAPPGGGGGMFPGMGPGGVGQPPTPQDGVEQMDRMDDVPPPPDVDRDTDSVLRELFGEASVDGQTVTYVSTDGKWQQRDIPFDTGERQRADRHIVERHAKFDESKVSRGGDPDHPGRFSEKSGGDPTALSPREKSASESLLKMAKGRDDILRDDNGDPRVVWHGSQSYDADAHGKLTTGKVLRTGKPILDTLGVFFTSVPSEADIYARTPAGDKKTKTPVLIKSGGMRTFDSHLEWQEFLIQSAVKYNKYGVSVAARDWQGQVDEFMDGIGPITKQESRKEAEEFGAAISGWEFGDKFPRSVERGIDVEAFRKGAFLQRGVSTVKITNGGRLDGFFPEADWYLGVHDSGFVQGAETDDKYAKRHAKFDESKVSRGGDSEHPGRFSEKSGDGSSEQKSKGKQTDTPKFTEWFGASKVIDDQGEPLRLYHGTDQSFETFGKFWRGDDEGLAGLGWHYLSDDPKFASEFAVSGKPLNKPTVELFDYKKATVQIGTQDGMEDRSGYITPHHDLVLASGSHTPFEKGSGMFPVHDPDETYYSVTHKPSGMAIATGLDLEHAMYLADEIGGKFDWSIEDPKGLMKQKGIKSEVKGAIKSARELMREVHEDRNEPDYLFGYKGKKGLGVGSQIKPVFAKMENPLDLTSLPARRVSTKKLVSLLKDNGLDVSMRDFPVAGRDLYQILNQYEIVKVLRAQAVSAGFDGIKFNDYYSDNLRATTFIAFEPTQIKSAIGNKGDFDPEDPRITYAKQFDESQHDRDEGGQFSDKAGGGSAADETDEGLWSSEDIKTGWKVGKVKELKAQVRKLRDDAIWELKQQARNMGLTGTVRSSGVMVRVAWENENTAVERWRGSIKEFKEILETGKWAGERSTPGNRIAYIGLEGDFDDVNLRRGVGESYREPLPGWGYEVEVWSAEKKPEPKKTYDDVSDFTFEMDEKYGEDFFSKWTEAEQDTYDELTEDYAKFREADHPRAADGKFGSGGGSATTTAPDKLPIKPQVPDVWRQHAAEAGKRLKVGGLAEKIARREPGKGEHVHFTLEEVDDLLKHGIVGLISAGKNPNYEPDMSPEQAAARHDKLKDDLVARGFVFSEGNGRYEGHDEAAILVMIPEASRGEMVEMGEKYNQDSVIWSDAGQNHFVYTTGDNKGQAHKGSGFDYRQDASDFYTEFCEEGGKPCSKFMLNFNFGSTEAAQYRKQFEESNIKRDDKGQFATKGGAAAPGKDAPATTRSRKKANDKIKMPGGDTWLIMAELPEDPDAPGVPQRLWRMEKGAATVRAELGERRKQGLEHSAIKSGGVSTAARRKVMGRAVTDLTNKMSQRGRRRMSRSVKQMLFHGSREAMDESIGLMGSIGWGRDGHPIAAYDPHTASLHMIDPHGYTDHGGGGLPKGARMVHIFAHAMTHAIDGRFSGHLSSEEDWKQAWKVDLSNGELTNHASQDAREGFAEFGRLILTRKDRNKIREEYPNVYAFWKDRELV